MMHSYDDKYQAICKENLFGIMHGLRTPGEEIAFTARRKSTPTPKIFRYGRSIFCLPHRPNFSDSFELWFIDLEIEIFYDNYSNFPFA